MRQVVAIIIFLLSVFVVANTYAKVGTVVSVIDGDTIKVINEDGLNTVRLYGIDCPEKKQAYGIAAKDFTDKFVLGKMVDVSTVDIDKYGRTVGIVMLGTQCLQEQLLLSGYAWVYSNYCKKNFCKSWKSLQSISEGNKIGLWIDPVPVQPWEWRRIRR